MGGGEHGRMGVDGFAEVLRADKRVLPPEFVNLIVQEGTIKAVDCGNLFAIHNKEAAYAVTPFKLEGEAPFAIEERVGRPGGAAEQAGGVAGGGHGSKALVVDVRPNVLGLVDDEQAVGGGAHDAGGGLG